MALNVPCVDGAWSFGSTSDPMGRGEVKTARVESNNAVEFGPPYGGRQYATLHLRVHPKHGKDIILTVERGQFLCRIDGCNVAVRFDEGKAQTVSAAESGDHDNKVLFIRGFDRFLSQARKAKQVRIESQFYQEGNRVFDFDVSGLGDWPAPPKRPKECDDPKCLCTADGVLIKCSK